MHAGRSFTLRTFIYWTRRYIYGLLLLAIVPTALYHFLGWTFLSLSWLPVAMLGTAVSFLVGFKNNASYARLWEARQIYGGIINASRSFAVMVREFLSDEQPEAVPVMFRRHYAWLTALRYQLREPRAWENMTQPNNVEFSHLYPNTERTTKLDDVLTPYLSADELGYVLAKKNRATQIMAEQSRHLHAVETSLSGFEQMQLQTAITTFYELQGKAERIKNFPYPRNFSSVTTILLYIFVGLVPFGLLNEFEKTGNGTFLEGYTVWLNVPFATLLTWVFVALDQVGESSANPFEGGANDVPITNISRTIEIDMRDMLNETNLPPALTPVNDILL